MRNENTTTEYLTSRNSELVGPAIRLKCIVQPRYRFVGNTWTDCIFQINIYTNQFMDGHAYYAVSSGVFLQSTGQAIETNKRGG